jgi:hypothetical protein
LCPDPFWIRMTDAGRTRRVGAIEGRASMMKKPNVADVFARAVIERDFAQAYDLTTRGLRARMDLGRFARALEDAEAEVAPPGRYQLGGNPISFQELAESAARAGKPLPDDIDGTSFRRWLCIEFQPDPDDESELDACYDLWCLTVEEEGDERVAYFEVHDPD